MPKRVLVLVSSPGLNGEENWKHGASCPKLRELIKDAWEKGASKVSSDRQEVLVLEAPADGVSPAWSRNENGQTRSVSLYPTSAPENYSLLASLLRESGKNPLEITCPDFSLVNYPEFGEKSLELFLQALGGKVEQTENLVEEILKYCCNFEAENIELLCATQRTLALPYPGDKRTLLPPQWARDISRVTGTSLSSLPASGGSVAALLAALGARVKYNSPIFPLGYFESYDYLQNHQEESKEKEEYRNFDFAQIDLVISIFDYLNSWDAWRWTHASLIEYFSLKGIPAILLSGECSLSNAEKAEFGLNAAYLTDINNIMNLENTISRIARTWARS
ncbi:hypothetical protein KRX54_04935 [Actinomycetaceae bacterium TAE3-ERU4]|nr:hypothetical protein [Actinomycetaceae bacterium TAE3-ERU4]